MDKKKCEINTFEEIVTWSKMDCIKYTFQYLLHTSETLIFLIYKHKEPETFYL